MAISSSTLASIIIGATAITGSAFAVSYGATAQNNDSNSSITQLQPTQTPESTPVATEPSKTTPLAPTPLPTQDPFTPPPSFNNGDDDDDEDEEYDDEDGDWDDDDDAFRGTSDKTWDYMYRKITTNPNMSAVQKWLDLLDFADPAPTPKKLEQRMVKIKNWLYRLSPEEKREISAARERIKARELEGKEDYYDEDYS